MSIDLQKLEQKFEALFNDPNFESELEQWLEARNVSQNSNNANVSRRFDGCSTCKNNIDGVEAGLWCMNNCIAGSRYEAVQNGG